MFKIRNFVFLILVLSALALPVFVYAQEATDSPTPVVVTQEPAPVPDPGQGAQREDTLLAVLTIVGSIGGGFLAGRYSQGVGVAARELEKNKQFLDASERLATNTIPVTALDTIRGILSDAQVGLDILKKITDGVPNAEVAIEDPNGVG